MMSTAEKHKPSDVELAAYAALADLRDQGDTPAARRRFVRTVAQYLEVLTPSDAFVPGDVVELKSGGPTMTVDHIEAGRVYCEWFAEHEQLKNASFSPSALRAA